MKKIKIFATCIILALAVYVPLVHANETEFDYLKNAVNKITSQKFVIDGPLYDYDQPLYLLEDKFYREKYPNVSIDRDKSTCDSTKCKIVATYNDETYTINDFKYYVSGLSTNLKNMMTYNVGDTLTINAKVYDDDGITQFKEAVFFYHIDGLTFTNNSVKFTKPGIYKGYVESTNRSGETLLQQFTIYAGFQDYINEKLNTIDSVSVDLSEFGGVDTIFTNALIKKIMNENYYGSTGSSVCNESSCDIDVTLNIDGKNYTFKKNGVNIVKTGISINTFGNVDLNKSEEYTPVYQSYSGNVIWSSSNTDVATVDSNTGKVTAVSSGVASIIARTSNNVTNNFIVRVVPDDTYKAKIQSDFNSIIKNDTVIVLPTLSSMENDNPDFVSMLLYSELNKLAKKVNKNYSFAYGEIVNGKIPVKLSSSYEVEGNEYNNNIDFCKTSDYNDGFDCGITSKEVSIKYADQVSDSGYDSSLVNPAKEVLKQLKKKYMVNMEISFKDYLNHPEFVDNYDFVKDANIGKLLNNPKGFEISVDGRAGDASFENAQINGYPMVVKDGITYASSINSITIARGLVINGNVNDSEETKLNNIKATVSKSLDSTDKVEVKRNIDMSYNIVITKNALRNTNQNLSTSSYSVKSLLASTNSSSNLLASSDESIEFNAYINFKKVVTTKPATAKLKVAKGDNNSLKLTWNNVLNAEKYLIYRSTSKTRGYKKIKEVTTNEYTNTGLTYGTTYYYKIVSKNKIGSSKYSNIVYKKVTPNKVNNLRFISANNNSIKMSFDKVSTSGYEIYRSTNNKSWSRVATITKNSTLSYTNKKLSSNKKYYYKVRAYKSVRGKKIYGSFSSVVKMITAPAAPKVKVSLNNYNALNVKVYESKGTSKYLVYRSTSKSGTYTKVKELTAFGTFTESELNTGSTYYYKVKSCNSNGSCSGYSSIVSKKVTPKTPGLSLKLMDKKIVMVGIGNVDGADGFEIYRSTRKTSKYKKIATVPIEVSLNHADSVKNKTTYYYKVRAYRLVNGKKVYSDFSSYKKIKTK